VPDQVADQTKILVMGPEVRNPLHRGIYVYTKSLFAALKHPGFTTGFFTQSSIPANPRTLLEQIVEDLARPRDFDWYRGRKAWMKSKYRRLTSEVRNAFSPRDPKWQFLANVDYFLNAPDFFDAVEFGERCEAAAPQDLVGRFSCFRKRTTGELENNAVDIDLVTAAGYGTVITSAPTPVRSRTGKVKIVQTLHDLIPLEFPFETDDPELYLDSLRPALRYADSILAMSKYTSSVMAGVFPEYAEKCAVVYQSNPVEPLLGRQDRAVRVNWLKTSGVERQRYFVYLGVVEKRKNIETLLRAFLLLGQELGLKLLIAGALNDVYVKQTGLAQYFDSAEARADGIIYAGYVSDEQKVVMLQNAIALVFPSLIEGFGLPIVEAMSVGCPVITTRCSSIPEVGADAVLYLDDPYDALRLSELMRRVAGDTAVAAELRDKGLRRAGEFTLQAYTNRLKEWGLANGLFDGNNARNT
jgi:glycosyltransferase involved in cell wall biosynthesis